MNSVTQTLTENEISRLVIGEAIHVHQSLGPGLLESVYEECLIHRLIQSGLAIERQKPIPLVFEGIKLECGFRCDIVVAGKVLIEIKAVEALHDIHTAQTLTYLKLTGIKLALLINFNAVLLKDGVKRIVNNL
ncbi:MAG TPA: GxxExxY protein [Flavipsychrobacter sp.]|nr:GxxExxY protein [Flavipsychrobacter sp.]